MNSRLLRFAVPVALPCLLPSIALAQAANDECVDAAPIGVGSHVVDLSMATPSAPAAPCAFFPGATDDVWYEYTAAAIGRVELEIAPDPGCMPASLDQDYLAVYASGGCGSADPLLCEGACGAFASWSVVAGETYLVRVGSNWQSSLMLDVAFEDHGTCEGAPLIGDGSHPFDSTGAGLAGPAFTCGSGASADVFFQYTPDCDALVSVEACGAGFDTAIEVYDAWTCANATPFAGTPIACASSTCTGAELTFMGTAATPYLIRIAGEGGASGPGTVTVQGGTTPLNVDCANAQPLGLGTTEFSNLCVPFVGVHTIPCSFPLNMFGYDLWFAYTAPAGGATTIDTCGSTFDTGLEVFGPGACGAAPAIACSDNDCGDASSVTFAATAGETYLVRVGGNTPTQPQGGGVITVHIDGDLGTEVCPGVVNSTGMDADLRLSGSATAADNALAFRVTDLPQHSTGYFLNSLEVFTVLNPGGSQGNLCIASFDMGRHSANVLDSSSTGEVGFAPDLGELPRAMGPVAAMAGETWYWQYWYRDANPGPTSNFSSARCLTFL